MLTVHGGPGSNSFYLEKEGLEVFNQDVQIIYLDQRGCGRSDTATDYSLQRIVKDFEEVRKALGIQKWIVLPHSFGGILATEYAYTYPQSIKAMVYLNCTVNISRSAKSGIRRSIDILDLKEHEKSWLLNDSVPLLERWGNAFWHLRNQDKAHLAMFDHKENYKLDSALMQLPFLKWHFGQKIWTYSEYFNDFADKTAYISAPTLIISGTRDYTIGTDHPLIMKFPHSKIYYIEGGHALYLEHNRELYEAVAPFLRKMSGSR
jgi:proline iminopeptidase